MLLRFMYIFCVNRVYANVRTLYVVVARTVELREPPAGTGVPNTHPPDQSQTIGVKELLDKPIKKNDCVSVSTEADSRHLTVKLSAPRSVFEVS